MGAAPTAVMVPGLYPGAGAPADARFRRCAGCGGVLGGCGCGGGSSGSGGPPSLDPRWPPPPVSARGVRRVHDAGGAAVVSPPKRARRASLVPPSSLAVSPPVAGRPQAVFRVLPPGVVATPPVATSSSPGMAAHIFRVVPTTVTPSTPPPRPPRTLGSLPGRQADVLSSPSRWGRRGGDGSAGGRGTDGIGGSPWQRGPNRSWNTPSTPVRSVGPPRPRVHPAARVGMGTVAASGVAAAAAAGATTSAGANTNPSVVTPFRVHGGSPHPAAAPSSNRPPIRPLVIRPATNPPPGAALLGTPREWTPARVASGPPRPRPLGVSAGSVSPGGSSPSIARQLFGTASDTVVAVASSPQSIVSVPPSRPGGGAGDAAGAKSQAMVEESPRAMASPSQRHFGVLRSLPVASGPRVPLVVRTASPTLLPGPASPHGPASQPGLSALSVSHCTSLTPLSAGRTQPDVGGSLLGGRMASPARSGAESCRSPFAGLSPRLQLLQRRAHTSAQMLRHAAANLLSAVEVTAAEARAIAASSLLLHIVGIDAAAQTVVAVLLEPPPVADTAAAANTSAVTAAAAASQVGSEVPGLAAGDRVAIVCPPLLAALRAEASVVSPGANWRIRMPPPAGVVLPSALPGGTGRRLRVAGVVLGLDFVPLDGTDPLLSHDAATLSARLARGDVDAVFPRPPGADGGDEQNWASTVIRRFSCAENLFAPRLLLAVKVVRLLASRRALVEDNAGQLGVIIFGPNPSAETAFEALRTGVTFEFQGVVCTGRSTAVATAVDALAGHGYVHIESRILLGSVCICAV
ncbi:hypothetical protein I4F81_007297 [Pyropia yezoensis]|uniref:Uncharacterized protein n=1 Tax=Pyropia yezoensis TaxID=2788 RepID=A0ACC3C446_PYRYE|nr:hypothetical protein I4F81_007297 [Neopyropia yezoensis]